MIITLLKPKDVLNLVWPSQAFRRGFGVDNIDAVSTMRSGYGIIPMRSAKRWQSARVPPVWI